MIMMTVIPTFLKQIPIYYENGKFTPSKYNYIPIDEKQFWENLETHKQDMIRELARGTDVYSEKELKVFEEYKQWLEIAPKVQRSKTLQDRMSRHLIY